MLADLDDRVICMNCGVVLEAYVEGVDVMYWHDAFGESRLCPNCGNDPNVEPWPEEE